MELPKRKHPRLKEYDYSQNGCYFVTICTKDRQRLLSSIVVGRDDHIPPQVQLTEIGAIVDKYIRGIERAYETVFLDAYVIMPDHIHLLVRIEDVRNGPMWSSGPTTGAFSGGQDDCIPSFRGRAGILREDPPVTLQRVVRSLKTMVTKEIGRPIWQDSFYDHVIRSEQAYCEVCQYMDENPGKWAKGI